MNKFNKGDRVVFKKNTTTFANGKDLSKSVGVVVKVFDDIEINTVLVNFDGEICKIPVMFLDPAPDDRNKSTEGKAQAVQITIDDFHDYAVKFTSLKYLEDLFDGEDIDEGGLAEFATVAAIIFDNLETLIFGEAVND